MQRRAVSKAVAWVMSLLSSGHVVSPQLCPGGLGSLVVQVPIQSTTWIKQLPKLQWMFRARGRRVKMATRRLATSLSPGGVSKPRIRRVAPSYQSETKRDTDPKAARGPREDSRLPGHAERVAPILRANWQRNRSSCNRRLSVFARKPLNNTTCVRPSCSKEDTTGSHPTSCRLPPGALRTLRGS